MYKKLLSVLPLTLLCIHVAYGHFKPEQAKTIVENLYTDISGFKIKEGEAEDITAKGGAPTYGEITFDSMQELFDDLKPTKNDTFYDLGCGVGKTCVQAVLTTPMKKAVGVELSPTRLNDAQKVKELMLKRSNLKKPAHRLTFKKENITETDVDDATIVYISSLCFSDELLKAMTKKLAQLKPGLRVITMRTLPAGFPFTFIKEYKLPMSWSEGSPLYLYELKEKAK